MGAFKAYDIRGVYNEDFNKETAYKVGFFLPGLLKADQVVVGRDVRQSSPEIHEWLCKGIVDSGADVWDIGLASTPMVYFATAYLNAGASVQITASHNPKQYNGMKISRAKAIPVGADSGLKELEKLVGTEQIQPAATKGKIIEKDIRKDYLDYQKSFLPDLNGLKLAIDCSNGMSSLFVHELFGDNAVYINDNLDGTFPAHEPNPLEPKNCQQLMELVKKTGADIGMIYDGDADRFISVDENGRFIQPDYLTAVIGSWYIGNSKEKERILVDIRTSQSTVEYLKKQGAEEVIVWKVGHAYAKNMLRERNCVAGGELAGHYYFKDFYNCDSGLHASIIVLNALRQLKNGGKTFSSLIDNIIAYANSGETNFRLDQKDECMQAMYDTYSKQNPVRILDFDGYRIEFPTWWFNVRKSNTEPFLRLVVEARTQAELDQRMGELKAIIAKFN